MNGEINVQTSMFGVNTYSYMRSHSAEDCMARLADLGFQEFELMCIRAICGRRSRRRSSAAPSASCSHSGT